MSLRIGIDLVEIKRFKNIAKKTNFLANIFTERELKDCEKKQAESLAARFAAKEAVKKPFRKTSGLIKSK